MKHAIKRGLFYLAVFYSVCLLVLFVWQRDIMYQPVGALPPTPDWAEQVTFETQDGLTLTGWYAPAPEKARTLLLMHGNYGHIGLRGHKMRYWKDKGYGVFLFSWRGFSDNPGSPSEEGLYQDARAALAWLKARGIPSEQILLYGESLGTGVAVQMAAEGVFAGLVLESPYASALSLAQERYPVFPIRPLMHDHFDSLSKISSVTEPLFILHGVLDRVIPFHHAERLYEAANEPKTLLIENGGDHNHLYHTNGVERLAEALASLP